MGLCHAQIAWFFIRGEWGVELERYEACSERERQLAQKLIWWTNWST
jgi:hypothetical protein